MKRNKRGVSLIVLVITVIVMIILAAAVMISLSNTDIINRAEEAVDKSNLKEVQNLATLIWSEEYIEMLESGNIDETTLSINVKTKLANQGITDDDFVIDVTENGISVQVKTTLGGLVTSAADYGKTVNYEANGVTDWKVFYKQTVGNEEYVYLIASEKLAYNKVPTVLSSTYGASITEATVELSETESRTVGQIYWSSAPSGITVAETAKDKWLAEWSNYSSGGNAKCVSYFLNEDIWSSFANTTKYVDANGESYVKGAIGTPTAEMFVASWNEKREATGNTTNYNKKLELVANGTTGYYVNDITNGESTSNAFGQSISTSDPLYIWSTKGYSSIWLASPSGNNAYDLLYAFNSGYVFYYNCYGTSFGVRPVVCLNSEIPAQTDTNGNIVI